MVEKGAMRRLLPVFAVSTVLALTVAGCTAAPADEPEPQTITLAFGPASEEDAVQWDALADAFEEANPGVTIKRERLPGETWAQVVQTRVQAGNAPDLFEVRSGGGQAGSIIPFAEAGLLLPLHDPEIEENLPTADRSQWIVDGVVYGVPTNVAVNGLIWNAEAAGLAGVDIAEVDTMEDLIEQCADVNANGKEMFVWAPTAPASAQILPLTLATSSVYGPEPDWNERRAAGEVTFAESDGWRDALQTIVDMNEAGCFQDGVASGGFEAIVGETTSARALGLFSPSGAAKALGEASGGAVTLEVRPAPAPAGYDTYLSVTAAFSIAGSAKTKSPKLVESFLKFLASVEGSAAFADAQGSIPTVGADASSLLPQYQPVASFFSEDGQDQARGWPPLGWPNARVLESLGSGVQGLVTGQLTVDEVLARLDQDWG